MVVKAILTRSQMEMRDMLLTNGGKAILCYKVAKNLAELCSYSNVLWKIKLANNETGYLAEAISKHSVEGDA